VISLQQQDIVAVSGGSVDVLLGSGACVKIPANDIAVSQVLALADGESFGQRLHVLCEGTAAGVGKTVLTLANAGIQIDGSTALASITYDAAGEESFLQWNGLKWHLMDNVGGTIA